jgi:hypothetical protein
MGGDPVRLGRRHRGYTPAEPPLPPAHCRGEGEGRGFFEEPAVIWALDREVLTAVVPLVYKEGHGEVTEGHSLGGRNAVTFPDFTGSRRFAKPDSVAVAGLVRLVHFGRRRCFTRLGFNCREGSAPPNPPSLDVRCVRSAVEVRLGFKDSESAQALAAAPAVSGPGTPADPASLANAPECLRPPCRPPSRRSSRPWRQRP